MREKSALLKWCNRRDAYLSYGDARAFIQTLGIKNQAEWKEYCRSGSKPANIPSGPDVFYKGRGWVNYGDWLGTGSIAKKLINYRSFKEARKFTRRLGIKSTEQWRNYCKSGLKPIDIPVNPNSHYRLCGWAGYSDFFNANMRKDQRKFSFLDFSDARDVVRSLGLKSWDEWDISSKNKQLPRGLPRFPNIEYASQWLGWRDWLDVS
jgi:hypothetical protein